MKKIVASVGLVVLGASGMARGQEAGATAYKPWNISATLRGFYDDNINTAPNGSPDKVGSSGFQITPSVNYAWQNDQTVFSADYMYTFRYYETRPAGNAQNYDQDNNFDISLTHSFNERYQAGVKDSFVIGQEADSLQQGAFLTEPQRVSGNNIRNFGQLSFNAAVAPTFGLSFGYVNSYWNYEDTQTNLVQNPPTPIFTGNNIIPSRAGQNNRIEQAFNVDARWQLKPQTVGYVGVQYGVGNYTEDQAVANYVYFGTPVAGSTLMADSRNYRSIWGYVGVDHNFTPDDSGSLRGGIRSTDYYNSPQDASDLSPYVMASLRHNYLEKSYFEVGFSYDRNATDLIDPAYTVVGTTNGPVLQAVSVTLQQQSAVVYGSVNHYFLPNLSASATLTYQYSFFVGGQYNNDTEKDFLFGIVGQYDFNPFISASLGYNYDSVNSEVPDRSYNRNRVYVGVSATY
ncbi:MAG: outer membrane beta-barrel protein [Verrucomicrobiota bacterium]